MEDKVILSVLLIVLISIIYSNMNENFKTTKKNKSDSAIDKSNKNLTLANKFNLTPEQLKKIKYFQDLQVINFFKNKNKK